MSEIEKIHKAIRNKDRNSLANTIVNNKKVVRGYQLTRSKRYDG